MTKLYHLPGIIDRGDDRELFTMVSACGKKGPLRTRDAAETSQAELFHIHDVCPECLVKWDEAEERGTLRAVEPDRHGPSAHRLRRPSRPRSPPTEVRQSMEASVCAVDQVQAQPEEIGGCSCGVRFYQRPDGEEDGLDPFDHDCPLDERSQLGLAVIDERHLDHDASTGRCATCGDAIAKDGTCGHLREVFSRAGELAARAPVATLVPGRPGSVSLPALFTSPSPEALELANGMIVVVREDGAIQVHSPAAGPANCCDRRMVHTLINRHGVTLCPTCDAERNPS